MSGEGITSFVDLCILSLSRLNLILKGFDSLGGIEASLDRLRVQGFAFCEIIQKDVNI